MENREDVRRQAKEILNNFSKSLAKVKVKDKGSKSKESGFREEGSGFQGSEDFRERMFANTQAKEGDFILAEKKKW